MGLYENIKELRLLNGWSQDELAKRAGYTDRSTIAKIENGEVDLRYSKIMKFAEIFHVDPVELMDLKDEIREQTSDFTPEEQEKLREYIRFVRFSKS